MVIEEIRNIKSGKSDIRKFWIIMFVVLALLGSLFLWRGKSYYLYFYIASSFFLLSGLIAPAALRPVQKAWMSFGIVMGWIVTRIILTVLFFVIVMPIGVIGRKLFGKAYLTLDIDRDKDTYWIPREKRKRENADYERQF